LIKDEARLPQCSFKARGLSLAITMANHFGVRRVAMASNGNAGGSMATYAARAGMQSVLFVPGDTPKANLAEAALSGSQVYLADGLIDQCGKVVRQGHDRGLWFDISTLKEPYRLEGKKTMGFELAEQLGWVLPDVILFPTGGGTAVIGMWKAFAELLELGWLTSSKMPRMIVVQSTGCQPLVRAFEKGERFAVRYDNATTKAAGLRVPIGIGDFMVLDAVQQSGGCVVAAEDSKLFEWQRIVAQTEGMLFCPESAACMGALEDLVGDGRIRSDEQVVIFNTAAGQKYMDYLQLDLPSVDLEHLDWPGLERVLDGPAFARAELYPQSQN
jgi:threonine synthase